MLKKFFNWSKNVIKNGLLFLKNIITTSYGKARVGEEKLNNILFYWCLLPSALYFLALRFIDCSILLRVIDIIILLLSTIDLYFITKAVSVHPEYDTQLTKELEKEEYYKTLTEEQLKEAKKQEKKDNYKKFLNKYIFLKYKDGVDFFKIVRIIVIIVLLFAIKRIFL